MSHKTKVGHVPTVITLAESGTSAPKIVSVEDPACGHRCRGRGISPDVATAGEPRAFPARQFERRLRGQHLDQACSARGATAGEDCSSTRVDDGPVSGRRRLATGSTRRPPATHAARTHRC